MAPSEVKMYSDYKSPFAYLTFEPGLELEHRYDVRVRWIPFQLRVKDNPAEFERIVAKLL
jgi:2-hydroxychromene-2-carboxylate isomerase